ncbi:AraC family transcriptional regulator [Streptomyces sp. NPDC048002]|uniref:AraC family transcriptional regulator n=1 Tax=Streptomyces sp. NPDC048002 TaxID=3154344 RepID=UPI00340C6560
MTADEDGTGAYFAYTTRSVEESHEAIAAHYYDLRLEVTGPVAEFRTSLSVVDLASLTVGDISFGTGVRMSCGEPGVLHVTVPLTGGFGIQQGRGGRLRATPRRAVLIDPEYGVRVDDWSADCHSLTVKIDKRALLHGLEALLGRTVRRPPRFEPYIDVACGPGHSWARLVRWLLEDRELPDGLLRRPLIRDRLEQTLLEGVLLAADHSYRTELEGPPPPMRPAAVKRVMDVVQELPAEPYDAARLAAIGHVSVRTLQDAFRKHVGVPPMAYVSEVRLDRVHGQLRASEPGTTTVAEVAYQWGFAHLGRFARRYRERFGESPSQTLRAPG